MQCTAKAAVAVVLLLLPIALGGPASLTPPDDLGRVEVEWDGMGPFPVHLYREKVKAMFQHAYGNYMEKAFPFDELKPISCQGTNNYGGYALTLIDALDTLVLMNRTDDFRKGVEWVKDNLSFDTDLNVSVFESTIRVVGGLLSAHLLASDQVLRLVPGYQGELLAKTVDLADRLILAFDTPTGIPVGTVNLRHGVPKGETREANVAGAGSLVIEWGLLSRLTGNPEYERVARRALESVWAKRSLLDLVGTHINIDTGDWTEQTTGIGAGVDSFYEYMFKAGLLFQEGSYIDMFERAYRAVLKHQRKEQWYADVNMISGAVIHPVFNALAAFWPGLEAMAGQISDAKRTLQTYFTVWRRFGFTPEGYNFVSKDVHEGQAGYPLRPEMGESAWYLYRATRDPIWLEAGRDMVESIDAKTRLACGFAAIEDVRLHSLADHMDSYFLAETLKYLYLLFDEDNWLLKHYGGVIFNTEGHLVPFNFMSVAGLKEPPRPGIDDPDRAKSCPRGDAFANLAAHGLESVAPSSPVAPSSLNASLGCSKCGHPVAAAERINVALPVGVTSHYEATHAGAMLVHKFTDPASEDRELALLHHVHDNIKVAPVGQKSGLPGLNLAWHVMTCAKCGHFLGFLLKRDPPGQGPPPHSFAGFFTQALQPLSPAMTASLATVAPVEAMQKFLSFAQQSLGHLSQKDLLTNAQDGRVVLKFEDPIASYYKFSQSGELMRPLSYGAPATESTPNGAPATPSESRVAERSPGEQNFAAQVEAGIRAGLPVAQQQALLELVQKGEISLMLEVHNDLPPVPWEGTCHILSPQEVAQELPCIASIYGSWPEKSIKVVASVVNAVPSNGCSGFTNAEAIKGQIALVARGACTFVTKVAMAQQAGAAGVLVYNNVPGEEPLSMGSDLEATALEKSINIPSAMVALQHGILLSQHIVSGATLGIKLIAVGAAKSAEHEPKKEGGSTLQSVAETVGSWISKGIGGGDATAPQPTQQPARTGQP